LAYFFFKALFSIDTTQIGNAIQNVYKQIKNRKNLEETQHKLFAQRVELKQRQKELTTELNVVEGVKLKRDKIFLKNQSSLVNQIQKDTVAKLKKFQPKINHDDTAQQLMVAEARQVKQIRKQYADILSAHPVFSQWKGTNPNQKIPQINHYVSELKNISETEKNNTATLWRKELQTLNNDMELNIDTIKSEFNTQHQQLFSQAQNYKNDIEEAITREIKIVRKEIDLDNKLFDESYRDILRTRIALLKEQNAQEQKIDFLNKEIQLVREAIAEIP
jgi:hypothetical protein